MESTLQTKLFLGNKYTDFRGSLTFFNDFDMEKVKRFYRIDHPEISVVRAWQGHRVEEKWFYVIKGNFLVSIVKPVDWEFLSDGELVQTFELSAEQSVILHVPGGHFNGFMATEPGSAIIIFSNFSVSESEKDNFRVAKEKWFNWNQDAH